MQEQIINFQTAKLAKEKGFTPKNLSIGWKEDSYLWMCELQRWLREVHKIHIRIEPYYNKNKGLVYGFDLLLQKTEEEDICEDGFKTYEEALEIGLKEGLKLIK